MTMKAKLKLASMSIPRPGMFGAWLLFISDQASAGRRRPRRPGFLNPLFLFWDHSFVSQEVAHQEGRCRKLGRPRRLLGRERGLQQSRTARTSTSWGDLFQTWFIINQKNQNFLRNQASTVSLSVFWLSVLLSFRTKMCRLLTRVTSMLVTDVGDQMCWWQV